MNNANQKPNEIYGSLHLLRLLGIFFTFEIKKKKIFCLAKMGELLSYTFWDEVCIKQLVFYIEDVMM